MIAATAGVLDVHQHLWPEPLLEALRAHPRSSPGPRLDGWTLQLPGEPAFEVSPADHDPVARQHIDSTSATVGVSLSSPLGIESLHPTFAAPLLRAWHSGAAALPSPFRPWAAVSLHDPDLRALAGHLAGNFLGLQLPASALSGPAAVEALSPVLQICQDAGKPVLVHPGPVAGNPNAADLPGWWAPVVDYPAQLAAAWWAWHACGRALLPALRICFVAGAGLAPLHHERYAARGGDRPPVIDPLTFVETSSYGPRAVDALIRVLGIDVIVNGTDRPYAGPSQLGLGEAATRAVNVINPTRLLEGGTP